MSKKDIKILVIDREHKEDEKTPRDLKEPARLLRSLGYDIAIQDNTRKLDGFEIIIAHPPWGEGRFLYNHKIKNPNVQMLLSSYEYSGGDIRLKENIEFRVDEEGIYYSPNMSLRGLKNLMKIITQKVYQNRLE